MNMSGVLDQGAIDEVLESVDTERWAPFPGYEDRYEISTYGNARHRERKYVRKLCVHNGYLWVTITTGKKTNNVTVHRRVLMAFDRMPLPGEEACHNDGNPLNARLSNLRWDTHSGNEADKKLHGTVYPKQICVADQEGVIRLLKDGMVEIQIASLFGISKSAVHKIKVNAIRENADIGLSIGKRMQIEDALKIRELHTAGERTVDIAKRFGLHRNHVGKIISGQRWKKV